MEEEQEAEGEECSQEEDGGTPPARIDLSDFQADS